MPLPIPDFIPERNSSFDDSDDPNHPSPTMPSLASSPQLPYSLGIALVNLANKTHEILRVQQVGVEVTLDHHNRSVADAENITSTLSQQDSTLNALHSKVITIQDQVISQDHAFIQIYTALEELKISAAAERAHYTTLQQNMLNHTAMAIHCLKATALLHQQLTALQTNISNLIIVMNHRSQ